MLICILTKNVITSCSVTMMLFLHLEVKPLMTLTTVLYLSCALISGHLAMMLMELTRSEERSAGMPRPISYAVFCLKKKKKSIDIQAYLQFYQLAPYFSTYSFSYDTPTN